MTKTCCMNIPTDCMNWKCWVVIHIHHKTEEVLQGLGFSQMLTCKDLTKNSAEAGECGCCWQK